MTTSAHHCQRPGCKGLLRSPESVARGMSKACDRKVRNALTAAAEVGSFTPDQQAKASAAIRSGHVTTEAPGLYGIPSSKNDGSRYASDGNSCVCPAGARQHPRRCWHLLVARVMDILSRRPEFTVPVTLPAPAPARDVWAELESVGALDLIPAF